MEKAEKIIKKFVEKEFPLNSEDKKRKSQEMLIGWKLAGMKQIKLHNKHFVITLLPEGVFSAIDEQGNLYDLDEMFF
ncbi:MAG: hypothetical protein WC320_02195 [Candidatus Paceibacterota bacterium]|jgi:hypothetical protein